MKLTTAYIQTLSHQLQAMTSFARTTDLAGLQQTWPMTQKVLEVNGLQVPPAGELPAYDVDIPSFQHSILGRTRPNLSNAVVTLLSDPSPQGIALIKGTTVGDIEAINNLNILTETAGLMMMISGDIYLKLGTQLHTATNYFMSTDHVSNELLWQMRMIFAVNGLPTDVLKIETANTPHENYAFRGALVAMIKPCLDAQFTRLLSNEDSKTMLQNQEITRKRVEKAHQASLISIAIKQQTDKILNPGLLARLFGK